MYIVNLTQHTPSLDQRGVGPVLEEALPLLNFEELPSSSTVLGRAQDLAEVALDHLRSVACCAGAAEEAAGGDAAHVATTFLHENSQVMVGGAPYLMGPLCEALKEAGLTPVFAFSERVSQEQTQPDGSIKKVATFRHKGFVFG